MFTTAPRPRLGASESQIEVLEDHRAGIDANNIGKHADSRAAAGESRVMVDENNMGRDCTSMESLESRILGANQGASKRRQDDEGEDSRERKRPRIDSPSNNDTSSAQIMQLLEPGWQASTLTHRSESPGTQGTMRSTAQIVEENQVLQATAPRDDRQLSISPDRPHSRKRKRGQEGSTGQRKRRKQSAEKTQTILVRLYRHQRDWAHRHEVKHVLEPDGSVDLLRLQEELGCRDGRGKLQVCPPMMAI